jgi:hypothetical protein
VRCQIEGWDGSCSMADFIVVYLEADEPVARRLARDLERLGWTTSWGGYPSDLQGQRVAIGAELEAAAAVLMIDNESEFGLELMRQVRDAAVAQVPFILLRSREVTPDGAPSDRLIWAIDTLRHFGREADARQSEREQIQHRSPTVKFRAVHQQYQQRQQQQQQQQQPEAASVANRTASWMLQPGNQELALATLAQRRARYLRIADDDASWRGQAIVREGLSDRGPHRPSPSQAEASTRKELSELAEEQAWTQAKQREYAERMREALQRERSIPQREDELPTAPPPPTPAEWRPDRPARWYDLSPGMMLSAGIVALFSGSWIFAPETWTTISIAGKVFWLKLLYLLKLGATTPPIAAGIPTRPISDVVDCSVFAPPTAPPGKSVFVQVFLHLHAAEALDRAEMIASKIDKQTGLRSIATLLTEVQRGQRLAITFDCPELTCDVTSRDVVWRGNQQAVSFRVTIPPGTPQGHEFFPLIRVSIEGVPVGFVELSLCCAEAAVQEADGAGKSSLAYRYAFLSYASEDRKEVLKFARVLNAAKIGFFQDILSLEPGEEWEPRLREEINKCDVFYLFWSQHSANSKWVKREADYAYERAAKSGRNVPHITPIRLDGSAPKSPPHAEWMTRIHFDDRFRELTKD